MVTELREQADILSKVTANGSMPFDDTPTDSVVRRPDLLTSAEISTLKFRFAVGDMVMCSVDKGEQEGVVVKRCYREDAWPSGYYAAYQVRLSHCDEDESRMIFAPRDDEIYIRRPHSPPTIASSRRMSKERRLIQVLKASLQGGCGSDHRKQIMYDQLQHRHNQVMQRVIDDVTRGFAIRS